jgi:hypothetical protein
MGLLRANEALYKNLSPEGLGEVRQRVRRVTRAQKRYIELWRVDPLKVAALYRSAHNNRDQESHRNVLKIALSMVF